MNVIKIYLPGNIGLSALVSDSHTMESGVFGRTVDEAERLRALPLSARLRVEYKDGKRIKKKNVSVRYLFSREGLNVGCDYISQRYSRPSDF